MGYWYGVFGFEKISVLSSLGNIPTDRNTGKSGLAECVSIIEIVGAEPRHGALTDT